MQVEYAIRLKQSMGDLNIVYIFESNVRFSYRFLYSQILRRLTKKGKEGSFQKFPATCCVTNFVLEPNDGHSSFEALMKILHSV